MEKKQKQLIASLVILFLIVIVIAGAIIQKITPSKEVKDLNDYYSVGENEILIFMENSQYEEKGLYIDDNVYIDYDTVVNEINKRFYWDSYEKILLYTTPTEIIKVNVDEASYLVNKTTQNSEYAIVKEQNDKVYIALDFVKQYSNVEYETYLDPNRVVLTCHWGEEFQYAEAKNDLSVRTEPDIKSPIVAEVASGDLLTYVDADAEEITSGFVKVMTADGVIGYARSKYLMDSYYMALTNDYEEPTYSNITKDETINMVWHQVTNGSGADKVESLLDTTKGVNVISPTWFSIKNENGEITSLASDSYVEKAHNKGVEVWALVDDFDTDIDKEKLFGTTTSREKLSNELVAAAISNNIDGINIDFEKITSKTAAAYLEFIRELSVKCRNNGIVLSVDNYVPAAYNSFYDLEEQGDVVDYVICMAYDEHYAGSEESGSVSSISYVQDAVTNMVAEVPSEKVIMALPFYTRLWKETTKDGETTVSSEAYSMVNAQKLMQDKGVALEWNEEVGQYYGQYTEDDTVYKMWLEEEKSYELKLQTVFTEEIAGVSAWKLGLEDSDVWDIIASYTKAE